MRIRTLSRVLGSKEHERLSFTVLNSDALKDCSNLYPGDTLPFSPASMKGSLTADEVREGRRKALERVRNDWSFEPAPKTQQANRDEEKFVPSRKDEITEWRERTYALSDLSSEEEDGYAAEEESDEDEEEVAEAKSTVPNEEDPTSTEEEQTLQIRTRRRRRRLQEEMTWNDGLRFWDLRRDAWTCAQRPKPTNDRSPTSKTHKSHDLVLPIPPPFLPTTDPALAFIKPTNYLALYKNIVTHSMAPSIPINLSHLIPTLVAGWKDEGEWPPKSEPIPASLITTAKMGAAHAVKEKAGRSIMGAGGVDGTHENHTKSQGSLVERAGRKLFGFGGSGGSGSNKENKEQNSRSTAIATATQELRNPPLETKHTQTNTNTSINKRSTTNITPPSPSSPSSSLKLKAFALNKSNPNRRSTSPPRPSPTASTPPSTVSVSTSPTSTNGRLTKANTTTKTSSESNRSRDTAGSLQTAGVGGGGFKGGVVKVGKKLRLTLSGSSGGSVGGGAGDGV